MPVFLLRCGLALALACAAAHAAALEVSHNQGLATVPVAPASTAVFDLSILDDLIALGVPVAGVPAGELPGASSPELAGAVRVGTLFEPDVEALRALQPALILVGGRSAGSVGAMGAIAASLDLGTRADDFFASVVEALGTLGRIYQREARASELIEQLQVRRDRLLEATRGQTALVLFTVNGRVIPHAPGARFGIFHDLFGLTGVLPAQSGPAAPRPEPGSPEAKAQAEHQARVLAQGLAAEPDWLIVLDRGLAFAGGEATDLSGHPGVVASQAWQGGRVFYLDPAAWYRVGGGWQVIHDTLEAFRSAVVGTGARAPSE